MRGPQYSMQSKPLEHYQVPSSTDPF